MQVRRAYKFRAYLTRPQEGRAVRLLADHCDLYNAALEERREAWRMRKSSVCYGMQSAQLKDIRKTDPDGQGRHSFSAQQQTLYRLNTAFAAFLGVARFLTTSDGEIVANPRFLATSAAMITDLQRRMAHAKPGSYLPNGAAAKSGLNKSILDAGWSQFVSVLAAKAEEAGRRVILVNPAYTSIDCHGCGSRCSRPRLGGLHPGPLSPCDHDAKPARSPR